MKEVKVEVSKEPIDDATVSCKKLPIGIRLFNKLFGNKEKMTVIILGRDVQNIVIENKEGNHYGR